MSFDIPSKLSPIRFWSYFFLEKIIQNPVIACDYRTITHSNIKSCIKAPMFLHLNRLYRTALRHSLFILLHFTA